MAAFRQEPENRPVRFVAGAEGGFNFAPWTSLPPLLDDGGSRPLTPKDVPILERVGALVGLIALSPLMLLIAVAIKTTSPGGPVFYRQERVGLNRRRRVLEDGADGVATDRRNKPGAGRLFNIIKFRTMIPNAEKLTGPTWAAQNDSRITKLGRILRYLRLDELPQLINVLYGEMRLIEPRPERPVFVEELSSRIPDYCDRLAVPPGVTGLAQIERHYDASVDDVRTKVKYDIFYVRNRSLILDAKILLKTMDVVLRGSGAR